MIVEIAPAKINLYLHVGGLRRDRLHEIASLFVFAEAGDLVSAAPAKQLTLDVTGPFGGALGREPVERNLVYRAARLLQQSFDVEQGARLTLDKRLPIASGVGGGSADAAAALRALRRLWKVDVDDAALRALAFTLGADVPACLDRAPTFVAGAGETLAPGPSLPPLFVALVNPRIAMPTGPVFRDFDRAHPQPARPCGWPCARVSTYADVSTALALSRNDLEPFAASRAPVIRDVAAALRSAPGAIGARMSGSGATVFGLYTSLQAAARAAALASGRGWWSMSAALSAKGADT